jgi:hypothetical protein
MQILLVVTINREMKKLLILLVLVLLVAGGILYYKNWRGYFLHKRLPELVFLQSDSLYRITYSNIDIDEINGEIKISNIELIPDTTYKKISDSTLPRNLFRVTVPELYISNLRTKEALLNQEIVAGKLLITNPSVTLYKNYYGARPERPENVSAADVNRLILRSLQRIQVDTISITGANYYVSDWAEHDTSFAGATIDAQLFDVNISDSTAYDTSRVLFARRADLSIKKIVIGNGKDRYRFLFNDIHLDAATRLFTVQSISMAPRLNEAAFVRSLTYQQDRYDLDFTNLQFKQVNVQALLSGALVAEELDMRDASFKIFRDKSLPRDGKSRVGRYPQQALLKIPFDLSIRKLTIRHGFIEYKEKNPKTDSSGEIRFHDVYATLHNVTNRQTDISRDPVCTLNFNSNFLDKAALKATLNMYLNSNNGRFTIKGSMKGARATVFNLLSKPLGLAAFEEGSIRSLDFDLGGNDYAMSGSLLMTYDGLKVSLLKKDAEENKYKKKRLASLIANLTLKDANPSKKGKLRTVRLVNFPRDTQRSFFNLLWKSIFAGVKETVGIDDPDVH